MEFKVRLLDFKQGQNEIVLNEHQAFVLNYDISDRVKVSLGKKSVLAIVDHSGHLIKHGEIGLFKETALELRAREGSRVRLIAAQRPASLDFIKKKLDGEILTEPEIHAIITDLMNQSLSSNELAAFIAAVHTRGMSMDETVALTNSIYRSSGSLSFKNGVVASMHSIGGVAGDRVTMLIVPIIASLGITIPKTASRAISSASGTADAMEVLCPVSLSVKQVKKVVEKAKGCIVWGGAVNIAAADDKLIKIRNPLRLDPKPLLLSSILAKKKAEGADVVLLDLPLGKGSKLSDLAEARLLARDFTSLGAKMGMKIECTITDGSEPLISTIGPLLEARTVLETLEGRGERSLAEKACTMAGIMLSMVKSVTKEEGYKIAKHQLENGKALEKMREIIKLQGGNAKVKPSELLPAKISFTVKSKETAKISHVDNKVISRVCRALGAPQDASAGLVLHAMKGQTIKQGEPLFTLYSATKEKINLALEPAKEMIEYEKVLIEII